jgi:WD40 repeat protein
VRPDPLPERIEGPFDTGGFALLNGYSGMLYPSRPSCFMALPALESKEKDPVQVWDLRKMKPMGPVFSPGTQFPPFGTMCLSPDGVYLAARSRDARLTTILVWASATGKLVRSIEVDPDPQMKTRWIDFAGKDRLLTVKHKGDNPAPEQKMTYQVWDLKTGAEVTRFDYNLTFDRRWGALSPGGRYLAMEDTDGGHYWMVFFDLANGKIAGKFSFQGKKEPWGQACGIAFSRDGREVAMLWRLPNGGKETWGRLFSWDMATGKKLVDQKIGQVHPALDYHWFDGDHIQYLPDGKSWLVADRLIFDRASVALVGDIVPELKDNNENRHRRFLDQEHYSAFVPVPNDRHLKVVHLPGGKPPAPKDAPK